MGAGGVEGFGEQGGGVLVLRVDREASAPAARLPERGGRGPRRAHGEGEFHAESEDGDVVVFFLAAAFGGLGGGAGSGVGDADGGFDFVAVLPAGAAAPAARDFAGTQELVVR